MLSVCELSQGTHCVYVSPQECRVRMSESDKVEAPPQIANSGAVGTQTVPSSSDEATAIARFAAKGERGLRPVTTPELLEELARSSEPAEVKKEVAVSYLVAAEQTMAADLRVRLQAAAKETRVLARHVAKLRDRVGELKGDK